MGGKIKISLTHTLSFFNIFQCNRYLALTKGIKEKRKRKRNHDKAFTFSCNHIPDVQNWNVINNQTKTSTGTILVWVGYQGVSLEIWFSHCSLRKELHFSTFSTNDSKQWKIYLFRGFPKKVKMIFFQFTYLFLTIYNLILNSNFRCAFCDWSCALPDLL